MNNLRSEFLKSDQKMVNYTDYTNHKNEGKNSCEIVQMTKEKVTGIKMAVFST